MREMWRNILHDLQMLSFASTADLYLPGKSDSVELAIGSISIGNCSIRKLHVASWLYTANENTRAFQRKRSGNTWRKTIFFLLLESNKELGVELLYERSRLYVNIRLPFLFIYLLFSFLDVLHNIYRYFLPLTIYIDNILF